MTPCRYECWYAGEYGFDTGLAAGCPAEAFAPLATTAMPPAATSAANAAVAPRIASRRLGRWGFILFPSLCGVQRGPRRPRLEVPRVTVLARNVNEPSCCVNSTQDYK